MDAQTFADWGVDYLKFDGCNYCENQYKFGEEYRFPWLCNEMVLIKVNLQLFSNS